MFVSVSLRLCGLILLLTAYCLPLTAQSVDYTRWVNPFIGTGGHGHTFPGATMPFGMVQLSPDTRIDNWDGSSGYHYSDDTIYGFSHTHLSGTGIPDYCDVLFMPTVGEPQFFAKEGDKSVNGYASKFSHASEKAEPGYYSVKLDDEGILAEMTATKRVGFHRYTFPKTNRASIVLDLKWRDKVLSSQVSFVGNNRIEGFRESSSWAKNQKTYFVAEFSRPFRNASIQYTDSAKQIVYDLQKIRNIKSSETIAGSDLVTVIDLTASPGQSVSIKVAISHVSIEGARKNLAAELPGWDFDKVRADAKAAWNKELSKIDVSGGTDAQTTTFYTALYHTMIQPNVFNDVDGKYLGMDKKVHQLPGYEGVAERTTPSAQGGGHPSFVRRGASEQYTVFSLWDTFRAAHPLYTIIDQRRTVDFINTFIRQYEQGGRLPVWELAGNETECMIGYHAVSVIADAMAKGIKGFDYEKAYAAAKHSAELDHFGLASYKKRGYISMEDENESVSKTLEYAYDDWCIAKMAFILLREQSEMQSNMSPGELGIANMKLAATLGDDFKEYSRRARSFENLFDPSTGFMRPKKNGGFISPFAPNEVTFNFTEGNSWVYSFFVPQDVSRLMELQGGREKFAAKLDELFTTKDKLAGREQPDITGLIGQYAHGNEPSHHIAYLYNYAQQPWKTQKLVRQIMDEFYKPEPDGLIGNEDCGQMSAWFIMSASGIYEVTPGSGIYTFGTPLFPEVKYNLENGKTFTIRAKNVSSANKYILNAKLNGAPYKKAFLTHEDLMKGGVLEFAMIDTPVTTAFSDFPVSSITADFVAVPVIEIEDGFAEGVKGDDHVFKSVAEVALSTVSPGSKIFYTTNGSEPGSGSALYKTPFNVEKGSVVKAVAINSRGDKSNIAETRIHKRNNNWTVKIDSKYNRQYTGGGDEGLIDGIRGTVNFASGEWQGYQAKDFVATVDLRKETTVTKLGGGFLQNARSWIWMPTRIEFETSLDGVNFTKAAEIKTDVASTDMTDQIRDFVQSISPTKVRYVRVHAYNLGKIPTWHPGAGDEAFIFVDEIVIQ